ncbi:MAG: hypothetical protein NTZ56_00500 [Acidobacteria bacterium]|nr:hypothetical protein [Acidobacteriota bacterium]
MPRLLIAAALLGLAGVGAAQITKPPEFQENRKIQAGAASLDGSSHVSAERTELHRALLDRLRALPRYAEGVRLLESQLFGPAEQLFEKQGLPLGVAVTRFILGQADSSAELLCRLATQRPTDAAVLAMLGETVGAAPNWSARMLAAIRTMATPESADGEFYLARALLKQDPPLTAEALPHLSRSAALAPKETRALLELARQENTPERRPAAIAALEEALRRDEKLSVAHYRLAQLYRAAGQLEKSREHLRRYQELK